MPETTETPVLDLLASMTEASIEASSLDPETLMLVRIAALVAVDAPPVSYLMNLGVAGELDIDPDRVRGVLAAVAPIVGTARVASATTKIIRALALEIERPSSTQRPTKRPEAVREEGRASGPALPSQPTTRCPPTLWRARPARPLDPCRQRNHGERAVDLERGRREEGRRRLRRRVTAPGAAGFVPPAERIATFDNDGTLWCEKPLYVQADFVLRKWKAMAASDPSLRERQPYKAVVEGDTVWLGSLLDHIPEIIRGIGEAFGGITTDAFEQAVREFFDTATHPTLGVPYTEVAYRPMRDLLTFLEANGFRVFVCTGGGRDFVRVVSDELYGVPREQVIGSSTPVELSHGRLVRGAGVEQPVDDGPGKPVHIWARTGRVPLFAAGNSDGDIEMLAIARFGLLVHHDDGEREFAYDAGAEQALAAASKHGWAVASMRDDFGTVF